MLSFAIALAATSVAEQMAPAAQGMLQCQMPDVLFKTCLSLSKVRPTGPGVYTFESEIAVAPDVSAQLTSATFVRGSDVCDVIDMRDIATAKFTNEGHALPAAKAAAYRAGLSRKYAPLKGKTICTHIEHGDEGTETVVGTLNGKRVPFADYAMKWVGPDEGWKVALPPE